MEFRRPTRATLSDVHAFDRQYVGHERPLDRLRARYDANPELFVVAAERGDLVGIVHGHVADFGPTDESVVVCESIGVHPDRRGAGIGRRLLARFEDGAAELAECHHDIAGRVSVAAAADVEGFYERCGYEPVRLLLQCEPGRTPDPRDDDRYLGDRVAGDTRFVYFDRGGASPDRTAERYDAHVNTIYEKRV